MSTPGPDTGPGAPAGPDHGSPTNDPAETTPGAPEAPSSPGTPAVDPDQPLNPA